MKLLAGVVVASLGIHWGGFAAMATPRAEVKKAPAMVEMTVLPKKAPPPKREEPVAETKTEEPVVEKKVVRKAVAAHVAEEAKPAPAVEAPPVDFTGTTLTGGSDGWASAVGNGEAIRGPQAAPRAGRKVERDVPVAANRGTPGVVALADLSRSPEAPDLNARLAAHYPAQARATGITGRAVVRARIDADGRAHVLRVVSESGSGFGAACRATLDGSRWQAPLDQGGKPVATELSYTCRFEVGG